MSNYYVTLGSDQAAMAFLNYLKGRGVTVYDEELAQRGSLVVFDVTKRMIENFGKDAKAQGQLTSPFNIRIRELNSSSFIMRS